MTGSKKLKRQPPQQWREYNIMAYATVIPQTFLLPTYLSLQHNYFPTDGLNVLGHNPNHTHDTTFCSVHPQFAGKVCRSC
jgi:hypothetical protein